LMLSGHPNIVITRRTYMWRRFYNRFGDLSDPENFEHCLAAMLAYKHIQMLNPDPERIRRNFWQGEPSYARLFALFHQHYAAQQGKTRWGNQHKSIENDVDLLIASDPSALVIHMIRHPFDRIEESVSRSSYRKGKVGLETILWRNSSRMALRNFKKYPQRYLVLQCEQLFSDPKKTLQNVCTFLGEDFFPEILAVEGLLEMGVVVPGARMNEVQTPGRENVKSPTGLTPTERLFVQSRTSSEISALGYPIKHQHLSLINLLKYALVDLPLYLVGATFWKTFGRNRQNASNKILEYGI